MRLRAGNNPDLMGVIEPNGVMGYEKMRFRLMAIFDPRVDLAIYLASLAESVESVSLHETWRKALKDRFDEVGLTNIDYEQNKAYETLDPLVDVIIKDWSDGWWAIERKQHLNLRWQRPGSGTQDSARLGTGSNNYMIEGGIWAMSGVAQAIETNGGFHDSRCAIDYFLDGYFELTSPRNSRWPIRISISQAQGLAADIRSKVS